MTILIMFHMIRFRDFKTFYLKRSRRHKVFDEIAEYGKTSVGWFFGLKMHIVVNNQGQLIAFKIAQGNKHDVSEVVSLLEGLSGLSFGDKGYIGKKIFEELLSKGMKLITRKRKNMKEEIPLNAYEKQLLNQRGIVNTTNKWEELSTFFKYSAEIRRLIYTTNAIEGFHGSVHVTVSK